MRILWNDDEKRFEAQFGTGAEWARDKDAAQAAGFHYDGPVTKIWSTSKAAALDKLKGICAGILPVPIRLSITPAGLDAYNRLHAIEQKNAELKAWAKEQKKKLAKEEEQQKIEQQKEEFGEEECDPEYEAQHYREIPEYWKGKCEITRADLPADVLARLDKHESLPIRRAEPLGKCSFCGENIYFPDVLPVCMWCEDKGDDKFFEELIA